VHPVNGSKKKEHLQSDVGSTKHAAVPKLLLRKHAGISFQKKKTCRQQQQYQTRVVKTAAVTAAAMCLSNSQTRHLMTALSKFLLSISALWLVFAP
jgi:hypothetical protein